MEKRSISVLVLTFFVLLCGFVLPESFINAAEGVPFKDMSSQHPAYPYVNFLQEKDIINGYEDGSFRPDSIISRAEMVVLLARAADLDTTIAPGNPRYNDLLPGHWAYGSIEAASKAGLVKGFPGGEFRPDEPVSRSQISAMVLRLDQEPLPEVSTTTTLKDVPSGHWAEKDIAIAIDSGMMELQSESEFAPDKAGTRAETAQALAIMLNLVPEKAKVPLVGTIIPVKGKIMLTDAEGSTVIVSEEIPCTVDARIKSSSKSEAEIRFSDGSGLKLDENTEIEIKAAEGQTTILKNGSPGVMVDYLEIELKKGRIFGVLATTILKHETETELGFGEIEKDQETLLASLDLSPYMLLGNQEGAEEQPDLPWYKQQLARKVRVKVDMPWGVCAVRGTFWMNEVGGRKQLTTVAEGKVEVSSQGHSVEVNAGMGVEQTSAELPPPNPEKMTAGQKQLWVDSQPWVEERARVIEEVAPVISSSGNEQDLLKSADDIIDSIRRVSEDSSESRSSGSGGSDNNTDDDNGDSSNGVDDSNTGDSGNTGDDNATGDNNNTDSSNTDDNNGDSSNGEDDSNTGDSSDTGNDNTTGDNNNTGDNSTGDNNGDSSNDVDEGNTGDAGDTGDTGDTGDDNTTGDNEEPGTVIYYDEENQTYGPANGMETLDKGVIITASGVILQNLIINGDLLLDEGIGEGDVVLSNVSVNGDTVIRGGGVNSIRLIDCTLGTITVDKANNAIRVVAEGNTTVSTVNLNSGARLEEVALSGQGFSNIIISTLIPDDSSIFLAGDFNLIQIFADNINIQVETGNIGKIEVTQGAGGTKIVLLDGVCVDIVELNAATEISGPGEILTAYINSNNVVIEQTPTNSIIISSNYTAIIGGEELQADESQISGTWLLSPSYNGSLTSDLDLNISDLDQAAYYALFTRDGVLIGRKALGEKVRSISIVFSQPENLEIRFYQNADSTESLAIAGLSGTYSNGAGSGSLNFEEVLD